MTTVTCHILLGAGTTFSKVVGAFLWSGLVLLSAALVVVMKTRWGQSRPISKCIALSMLAHILLLAAAYGTNFISIPTPADPVVKVKLTKQPPQKKEKKKQPKEKVPKIEKQPWQRLADDTAPPMPALPSLPRQETNQEDPPSIPQKVPSATFQVQPKDSDSLTTLEPKKLPTSKIITPLRPAPVATPDAKTRSKKVPSTKQPQDTGKKPPPRVARTAPVPKTLGPVQAKKLQSSTNSSASPVETPPKDLPAVYRNRIVARSDAWLRSRGGSRRTERAVELALAWLARNQESDGHWDARRHGAGQERHVLGQERGRAGMKADTAMTGLALLAFLGSGHTHKYGKYRNNVSKGLEYLRRVQKSNGSLEGSATLFARMYCHGMATFAMAEACAMTRDAKLRPYVQRAIQFTIRTQNEVTGGWRYQVGDRGDMSQFGWQLLALKSAEQAGIATPRKTRLGMLRFLRSVSFGRAGGLASYRPGRAKSRTMTAEALVCRFFLKTANQSLASEAVQFIRQELPSPNNRNLYYWYYATLALQRVGDGNWRAWNRSLQQTLISTQSRGGKDDGSWSPQTRWGGYGGRVYTTAMATMCLEVYYRFDDRP